MLVEAQKVAGAVLLALIVFMGAGMLGDVLVPAPEAPHEPAVVAGAPGEAPAEPAEAEPEQPFPVLLAAATPEQGQEVAGKCRACHTFEEGGAHRVGPNLHGVVGADIASQEGYNYSDALLGLEGAWGYEELSGFLEAPGEYAPGTKMTFAGLQDPEERAAMIVYLASLSPQAPPLPEVEEPAAGEAAPAEAEPAAEQAAPAEEAAAEGVEPAAAPAEPPADGAAEAGDFATLVAAADPAAGEAAIGPCRACHTFEEGGAHRVGPNLHGVVGADIAGKEGFNYSPAFQALEGEWTYERLDEFLADPMGTVPGTRMAYAGIKDADERAAVVAYLRSLSPDAPPLPE